MADPIDHASALSPGRAWTIVVVGTLGMSVSYIDRQTLAAIAPSITKAFAIDNAHYGWLLSAFALAYLGGAPLAGVVVDRLGARRGFAAAVVVWSLVAGSHALATSFASLFALRALLGLAESPSFPAATQAVSRSLPVAQRPLALGMLFTGSTLGAIVAAKLAIALESAYGYRGAFVGTALLGALWIPVWLFATRRLPRDPVEARGESPAAEATWWSTVTSPAVLRALVLVLGSAPALMFVLSWTSKYLVDGWHLPKDAIGDYLIAAPLLFDIGAVGFGAIGSARQKRRLARGLALRTPRDLVLLAMVLAAVLALVPLAPGPGVAVLLIGVSAAGGGGLYALATADMLARVPPERTSTASGMTAGAQSLAQIIAGPWVGWTIDRTHGHATALVGLGLVVVPAVAVFVAWPRVDAHGPREEAASP